MVVPPIPREGTFETGNPFFRKGTHVAKVAGFHHTHSWLQNIEPLAWVFRPEIQRRLAPLWRCHVGLYSGTSVGSISYPSYLHRGLNLGG